MNSHNSSKAERIRELFNEFHKKMLVIMKKQTKLLEKVIKIGDKKEMEFSK